MTYRTLKASAINVALLDHTPERYVQLFTEAASLLRAVKVHGPRYAMLTNISYSSESKPDDLVLFGEVVTFTHVNTEAPWLDMRTGAIADPGDAEKVSWPDFLQPDRRAFRFKFYVNKHLFVVEVSNFDGTVSPGMVSTLLNGTFAESSLREKFGDVAVTVIPTRDAVAKILSDKIRWIEIKVRVPNPGDDHDDEDAEIEERMKRLGTKDMLQRYTAMTGGAVEPDKEMKALCEVASRNGYVRAGVLRHDVKLRVVAVSTQDSPLVEAESYNTNTESSVAGFERLAHRIYANEAEGSANTPPPADPPPRAA